MKRMRQNKDMRIEEVLGPNFGAIDNDLCNRCAAERMQDGRTMARPMYRLVSSRMETRIEAGEMKEMTYKNVMNLRKEAITKVDRLMKEALCQDSGRWRPMTRRRSPRSPVRTVR